MAVVLLLLIAVLVSVKGSERRFVAYGSDLLLEVKTAAVNKDDDFVWRFNTDDNLVKLNSGSEPRIKDIGRTEFFKQNYSLLLRNVTHNDSGNYKAIVSGLKERIVTEYKVKVQDPVSPVNLAVTLIDLSFCNFTATCRAVDSQIRGTFLCQNTTCHLLNQTDLKDSFLKIYVKESSIICNYSNHVSWTQDVKSVASLCEKKLVLNTATIVGISAGALLVVLVSILCSVLLIMCKRKRRANTVYEVPQENPQQNPYETPAEVTPSLSPTSTYALVQFANPPVQRDNPSTCLNQRPETIYAQVDRTAKSNSKPDTANR